ncbi:hypothetical protein [Ureibacillus aquaedulcis]|uniref:DUF4352 domain-containing protein n=1 Tax=Ureibacillus aquaedulcis TaxID=3058421 RepID=A0ABT8GKI7_9BACL|nr:hypothetical protein [Ureibacillus sp. BA0131]MDN4491922.1 hypothetical protein [Ureibacillus sp. BA0131]
MRFLTIIIIVLFLSACGVDSGKKVLTNEGDSIESIKSESIEVQDDFKLEIKSEKSQYNVGEELKITANLTYTGEKEIEIGHGGSWIYLNTTNVTKGYQFWAAMNQPHIVTAMTPNVPIKEQYHFSGGTYYAGSGGNPYTEEEYKQMADMNFPPGNYKIEGTTEFNILGEEYTYEIKTEISFEVIE